MNSPGSSSPVFSLRRLVARFRSDRRGNVAVIFAITLLPLLGLIGAAVDYARANNARTALQTALDTTALMISKDAANLPANQIQSRAQQYFNALYTHSADAPVSGFTAVYTANTGSGSSIVLTANSSIQTDFMKVMGSQFNQLNLSGASTTKWGSTKLRVALVLDNTGSMADNGKMTALQTAANNLIDQLSANAVNPGDVLISVIPFAKDVNVNPSNYQASWLTGWTGSQTQPSAWNAEPLAIASSKPSGWSSSGPGSSCPFSRSYSFSCTTSPVSGSATTSKIPSSGTYTGYICPGDDSSYFVFYNGCYTSVKSGGTYTHTWTPNNQSTWNGCVTDRTQPYDTLNTAPTDASTSFFVEQYDACPAPLIPLSSNWSALKSTVASMTPNGGTNQPIGLAWGWLSLTQTSPLNAPSEDSNFTYTRAIILLSDGLNTQDRWPAYGNGNTQYNGSIDARQTMLCNNIKAVVDPKTNGPAYIIFTIQVNTSTPADPQSSVLQSCASDSSKFVMLTSANQIISTFYTIGTQLAKLRITQ